MTAESQCSNHTSIKIPCPNDNIIPILIEELALDVAVALAFIQDIPRVGSKVVAIACKISCIL